MCRSVSKFPKICKLCGFQEVRIICNVMLAGLLVGQEILCKHLSHLHYKYEQGFVTLVCHPSLWSMLKCHGELVGAKALVLIAAVLVCLQENFLNQETLEEWKSFVAWSLVWKGRLCLDMNFPQKLSTSVTLCGVSGLKNDATDRDEQALDISFLHKLLNHSLLCVQIWSHAQYVYHTYVSPLARPIWLLVNLITLGTPFNSSIFLNPFGVKVTLSSGPLGLWRVYTNELGIGHELDEKALRKFS